MGRRLIQCANFIRHVALAKNQRAAPGVPKSVLRVHQNAERRRAQAFSPHRPLLERQKWPVGRRCGEAAEFGCDCANDLARPCIEGIDQVYRLGLEPLPKMPPIARACISGQQDHAGRHARGTSWPAFARTKSEPAAQDEALQCETISNQIEFACHRPETGRCR